MEGQRKEYRRSIMLTETMEKAIVQLRMDERYTRLSYAEIIRMLIQRGLETVSANESRPA